MQMSVRLQIFFKRQRGSWEQLASAVQAWPQQHQDGETSCGLRPGQFRNPNGTPVSESRSPCGFAFGSPSFRSLTPASSSVCLRRSSHTLLYLPAVTALAWPHPLPGPHLQPVSAAPWASGPTQAPPVPSTSLQLWIAPEVFPALLSAGLARTRSYCGEP